MQESNNLHNDEIRLKDVIFKIQDFKNELVSRWKLIFIFSCLFAFLGVFYSMKKQNTYKAELNFVIEDKKDGGVLGKYSGIASQFGFDIGGGTSTTFNEGNILQLLSSRRVVESTLLSEVSINGKKDLLINYHIDFNNYRESWAENVPEIKSLVFHNDRSRFSLLQDSILATVWRDLSDKNITVQVSEESSIISVISQSKNELFAKLLVEGLVAELKEYYTLTQTAKARESLSFIQNRADSVLNKLKLAELSYARHKDSNFGVMRAEGLLEEMRLKREVEILNVMYAEIIKNLEISKVTLLSERPLINIIDSPRFPLHVVSHSKIKYLALFGFLGLILSSIYVVLTFEIRKALEVN